MSDDLTTLHDVLHRILNHDPNMRPSACELLHYKFFSTQGLSTTSASSGAVLVKGRIRKRKKGTSKSFQQETHTPKDEDNVDDDLKELLDNMTNEDNSLLAEENDRSSIDYNSLYTTPKSQAGSLNNSFSSESPTKRIENSNNINSPPEQIAVSQSSSNHFSPKFTTIQLPPPLLTPNNNRDSNNNSITVTPTSSTTYPYTPLSPSSNYSYDYTNSPLSSTASSPEQKPVLIHSNSLNNNFSQSYLQQNNNNNNNIFKYNFMNHSVPDSRSSSLKYLSPTPLSLNNSRHGSSSTPSVSTPLQDIFDYQFGINNLLIISGYYLGIIQYQYLTGSIVLQITQQDNSYEICGSCIDIVLYLVKNKFIYEKDIENCYELFREYVNAFVRASNFKFF